MMCTLFIKLVQLKSLKMTIFFMQNFTEGTISLLKKIFFPDKPIWCNTNTSSLWSLVHFSVEPDFIKTAVISSVCGGWYIFPVEPDFIKTAVISSVCGDWYIFSVEPNFI